MKFSKWLRDRILSWLSVAAIALAMLLILWAWSALHSDSRMSLLSLSMART